MKAGTRQEAIDAAEAALQQAQAELAGAMLTLSDTLQIRKNPQQINAQVDAARSGVALAEQQVAAAQSKLAEARYRRDFYDSNTSKHETLDKQIGIAQKNLEAAQAQLTGARAQLAALQAMRSDPVSIQAQVNKARHAYSMTVASEAVAAANVTELKAGPFEERPDLIAKLEAEGRQRALIYKTLVLSGLRLNELRSLTVGAVTLTGPDPYAILKAEHEKSRRGAEILLRSDSTRNRRVGLALARGDTLEQILQALGHVAEGVPTAREVDRIARERGVDMPVTREVTRVLFEGLTAADAVQDLLAREPKSERG